MYIKEIKLRNYRNYEYLDAKFVKSFNIIYGENGQGKTNILEAIFMCAAGRSHRTSKDTDLIKLGKERYYISLNLEKQDNESQIEISYGTDQKKKVRLNEIPLKKIGNLMGNLNTVIFSPEDLMMIKEGPSERRRFLDITISQLKPAYFYDLQQYYKIISQRNVLLKEIQKKNELIDTLDIWDKNLAGTGAKIIKVRKEFVKRINKEIEKVHYKLTNNEEKLNMKYCPSIDAEKLEEEDEIEKEFLRKIKSMRKSELNKSMTLCGPQRDDFELLLNGLNIRLFGSQGQQRTAVLSMKLSEIDIMKSETEEYPVLLLDDVMSELDNKRQEYLIRNLKEIQTFITCTDSSFFKEKIKAEAKYIKVQNGKIEEMQSIV